MTKIAEGLEFAEGGERQRQPGERRHRAQHLEDRIEAAHRPDRLADERTEQNADDGRKAEADGDALQRDQHAPAKADILRTVVEERIDDQILAVDPDLRRRRQDWRPAPEQAICQMARSSAISTTQRRHDIAQNSQCRRHQVQFRGWAPCQRDDGAACAGRPLCLCRVLAVISVSALRAVAVMMWSSWAVWSGSVSCRWKMRAALIP